MLQLFKRVGGTMRGLFLLGFGALWGFAAFSARLGGAGDVTFVGIGALALIVASAGFVILLKAMLVPTRSKESKWVGEDVPPAADPYADPDDALDPDAAIQRYMANRGHSVAPAAAPVTSATPARPSFGRKGVMQ